MDAPTPPPEAPEAASVPRRWWHLQDAIERAGSRLPTALRLYGSTFGKNTLPSGDSRDGFRLVKLARFIERQWPAYHAERHALQDQMEAICAQVREGYLELADEGQKQYDLLLMMDSLAISAFGRHFPKHPSPRLTPIADALAAIRQATPEDLPLQAILDLRHHLVALRRDRVSRHQALEDWNGFDFNQLVPRSLQEHPTEGAVDGWEAYMDGLEALKMLQAEDPMKAKVVAWYDELRSMRNPVQLHGGLYAKHFEEAGMPVYQLDQEALDALHALVHPAAVPAVV